MKTWMNSQSNKRANQVKQRKQKQNTVNSFTNEVKQGALEE